ncbi:MAG: CdaR family protein, partial [Chloroflexota bacterium]
MRVPFGGVTLPPLRRRLDVRSLVLGDLPMKAAALAVALVLWIAAISSAPPPEVTVQFDGRVPVERPVVPEGYVLRGQLGDIGVRLRGPGPALAALGQQHLRATLDLSAVVPGPEAQEVPVRVAVADESVLVVEVSPATVAVRLERRTERILAVQARFANEPPAGFQAGAATFRPQEVSLSGPESLVATVAAVLATLRFGDAPVDLAQGVQPVAVDAAGERVEGV